MKKFIRIGITAMAIMLFIGGGGPSSAEAMQSRIYEVGPDKAYPSIGDVPWEFLLPGDLVLIYWRSAPYKEKWVICRQGTAAAPITVRGVPGPNGELPVIDGNGATTRPSLNYWNQERGVIKVGGANTPPDTLPKFITIENLDIRSARPPYTYTAANGSAGAYSSSASSIYVEKGEDITVRNCIIRDSANGFFVASSDGLASRNILVEGNYIYDNGVANSIYQHNNYTAAIGITFQYNRFGPPRAGCPGNNLKDRSAGLVVRYNWIEGGNRQLDLVDGEDSSLIRNDPRYRETFVYGNVLIEPDAAGNRQIVHYGGDSGATASYRKGTLYFYYNTVVSTRTDRTTMFRLSTNEEQCDFRNNIAYVTAAGNTVSLLDSTGILHMSHNWFKPGWVNCFGTLQGTVNNDGSSVQGTSPGFVNAAGQDFTLAADSACIDAGTFQHPNTQPANDVVYQYVKHLAGEARPNNGIFDIGAYEFWGTSVPELIITTGALPGGTVGASYSSTLSATGGVTPYTWSIVSGALPAGMTLNSGTGQISGTPTSAGTFAFNARVTDGQSVPDVAEKSFSITVNAPAPAPLNITTTSLPGAKRNKAYSQTLRATGGVMPYLWSLSSGVLPPGLKLNASTGVISGKPTSVGTWRFYVRVRDGQATPAADTQLLSITVTR